jgi:DNA-binding XRE family transcriptional regulator
MTGQELRALRKRLGMRQGDLGALLRCTRQQIGILENRDEVPHLYALAIQRVADVVDSDQCAEAA